MNVEWKTANYTSLLRNWQSHIYISNQVCAALKIAFNFHFQPLAVDIFFLQITNHLLLDFKMTSMLSIVTKPEFTFHSLFSFCAPNLWFFSSNKLYWFIACLRNTKKWVADNLLRLILYTPICIDSSCFYGSHFIIFTIFFLCVFFALKLASHHNFAKVYWSNSLVTKIKNLTRLCYRWKHIKTVRVEACTVGSLISSGLYCKTDKLEEKK